MLILMTLFESRARGFTSVDGKQFEWRRIREDTTAYDVSGMVKFLRPSQVLFLLLREPP